MTRNLKALGLALLAVFAMSAVAASAASAENTFTSGSDWTVLSAESKGSQVFEVKEPALNVTCTTLSLDNTTMGTDQKSITAEPTYGTTEKPAGETDCTANSTLPAIVHMNGCHYLFTAASAGSNKDGEVHIECPTGKEITVTVFLLGSWRECLHIPPQTPTTPTVTYFNETKVVEGKNVWDVKIKSDVEGIQYTKTSPCGTGTANNAFYKGEVTVTGTDTSGNPVDVTWDGEA